ncbi:hypothetical protein ACH5RR_036829 [Cinchona calisaya]|uniref:Uncharacterized protein n=1 Tax=Cinchona calisaya TaxID=153742 RepID=A0ABD2Y862_9GENT
MATCCLLLGRIQSKVLLGCLHSLYQEVAATHSNLNTCADFKFPARRNFLLQADFRFPARRNETGNLRGLGCRVCCSLGVSPPNIEFPPSNALMPDNPLSGQNVTDIMTSNSAAMQNASEGLMRGLMIIDLDPATTKLAIAILGTFLSAFAFLFILRIVMSWYPKLPVEKFPYVIAYAPTEPLLIPTRRLIPPLGGVDVTPVVWFGLISFLNEILVGPQGLLVLLSQ